MGLGPHPPYRPPHRDDSETGRILYSDSDARARARTRNRKPRTRFRSSSAECSRARGGEAFALHHPPPESLAVREDREQPVYGRRAGRRPPMELCPDSIRSSTSCRAIAARPAGNRRRVPRVGRSHAPVMRFRRANRLLVREDEPAIPPVDPLSWAARGLPPPGGGGPTGPVETSLRVCTRSASPPGTVGDTGRSRNLPPGVEGRFTRGPAKGQGISRTRGAFRRWAAFVESTGLTSRVI